MHGGWWVLQASLAAAGGGSASAAWAACAASIRALLFMARGYTAYADEAIEATCIYSLKNEQALLLRLAHQRLFAGAASTVIIRVQVPRSSPHPLLLQVLQVLLDQAADGCRLSYQEVC